MGTHQVRVLANEASGVLVLSVREPMRPAGQTFYDPDAVREIDPRRTEGD
ncbi:MAG: hypothetical protein ACRD2N_21890 [Vicinamibacterales bacterium]